MHYASPSGLSLCSRECSRCTIENIFLGRSEFAGRATEVSLKIAIAGRDLVKYPVFWPPPSLLPPFNWKTCRILGRPMCVHHVMARGYDFLSPSSFDGYRCFTFFFFYGFRHIFAHDTSHLLSRNWTIESFCDLHFFLSFNYFSCASYGFFPFSFYLYISSSWMTNDRSLISKNISSVIREYIYIYSE